MSKVRVQLFGRLGKNLGSELLIETKNKQTSIREVIEILIQRDPGLKDFLLSNDELSRGTILLINGHALDRSKAGLNTKLNDTDRVIIDCLGFIEIVGGG
ncbi:MAG: hypothetical protein EAX86_01515 [Candidatus Heimdallarchaeota archaeon]|nr:hypothetical protein [Candidatus Heimdallarchaeota archaeon]